LRCRSSIAWQVYVLIFVLQAASAAFTPTFQATIPDLLPEENDYTRALSLSRLAYDMESPLSPTLAAALLTIITYKWLFVGTIVGFLCSAALVVSVAVPQPEASGRKGGIYENTTRGIRLYLATPRLRGLLALNLSVAAAAMVIVNTSSWCAASWAAPTATSRWRWRASAADRWQRQAFCPGCSTEWRIVRSCSRRQECSEERFWPSRRLRQCQRLPSGSGRLCCRRGRYWASPTPP
jgi:MFS family permease